MVPEELLKRLPIGGMWDAYRACVLQKINAGAREAAHVLSEVATPEQQAVIDVIDQIAIVESLSASRKTDASLASALTKHLELLPRDQENLMQQGRLLLIHAVRSAPVERWMSSYIDLVSSATSFRVLRRLAMLAIDYGCIASQHEGIMAIESLYDSNNRLQRAIETLKADYEALPKVISL